MLSIRWNDIHIWNSTSSFGECCFFLTLFNGERQWSYLGQTIYVRRFIGDWLIYEKNIKNILINYFVTHKPSSHSGHYYKGTSILLVFLFNSYGERRCSVNDWLTRYYNSLCYKNSKDIYDVHCCSLLKVHTYLY